jgi:hypothetical protein
MTADRELLRKTLDALRPELPATYSEVEEKIEKAIAAIRARLAQNDDEPVAWMADSGSTVLEGENTNPTYYYKPLYLHPPAQKNDEPVARVNSEGFIVEIGDLPIEEGSLLYLYPPAKQEPLTDEQICDLWSEAAKMDMSGEPTQQHWFARAIEKAHGIGE